LSAPVEGVVSDEDSYSDCQRRFAIAAGHCNAARLENLDAR
jgi:hypothetical protein